MHVWKSVRRAREFVRGSTNGGMIEKERERERDGKSNQRGKSGPGTA